MPCLSSALLLLVFLHSGLSNAVFPTPQISTPLYPAHKLSLHPLTPPASSPISASAPRVARTQSLPIRADPEDPRSAVLRGTARRALARAALRRAEATCRHRSFLRLQLSAFMEVPLRHSLQKLRRIRTRARVRVLEHTRSTEAANAVRIPGATATLFRHFRARGAGLRREFEAAVPRFERELEKAEELRMPEDAAVGAGVRLLRKELESAKAEGRWVRWLAEARPEEFRRVFTEMDRRGDYMVHVTQGHIGL